MPTVTENVAVFMAVGLAIAVFREVYRSSLILDELEAVANAHDASVKALIELERKCINENRKVIQEGHDLTLQVEQLSKSSSGQILTALSEEEACKKGLADATAREASVQRIASRLETAVEREVLEHQNHVLRSRCATALVKMRGMDRDALISMSNGDLRNTLIAGLAEEFMVAPEELQVFRFGELVKKAEDYLAPPKDELDMAPCEEDPDPAMLHVLREFREENGAEDSELFLGLCRDEARNALIDEIHGRAGMDTAGVQSFSDSKLVSTARKLIREGILRRGHHR